MASLRRLQPTLCTSLALVRQYPALLAPPVALVLTAALSVGWSVLYLVLAVIFSGLPAGLLMWLSSSVVVIVTLAQLLVVCSVTLPLAAAIGAPILQLPRIAFDATLVGGPANTSPLSLLLPGGSLESIGGLLRCFHLGSRYGLFARMTTFRHEMVFEGSDDCGSTWHE